MFLFSFIDSFFSFVLGCWSVYVDWVLTTFAVVFRLELDLFQNLKLLQNPLLVETFVFFTIVFLSVLIGYFTHKALERIAKYIVKHY